MLSLSKAHQVKLILLLLIFQSLHGRVHVNRKGYDDVEADDDASQISLASAVRCASKHVPDREAPTMFVLGCHRSGTSLLAGIISDALPKQPNAEFQDQLPAQVDNPGGFFESRQLVSLNESLLSELGIDWQYPPLHAIQWQRSEILPKLHAARRSFTEQALDHIWVDKDPRLCLTYPAFQHILLKRTPIAAVLRHPFEVAGSLQTRDMIPLAKGLIIWLLYNQHLSRLLTPDDVLVSYESLVNSEETTICELSEFIARHIPESGCSLQSLRANLSQRAQPQWRRNHDSPPQTLLPEIEWTEIAKVCLKCYQDIRESNFSISEFKSSFSNTPDPILRGCAVFGWQTITKSHEDLSGKLEAARSELSALKKSSSWRLTAPIRWLADRIKQ